MRRSIIPITFLALAVSPVMASECVSIDNDLDRLACYDIEAGRTPVAEEVTTGKANWKVEIEKSDFQDTNDVYLQTESAEGLNCQSFGAPEPATLLLRCKEDTTSIFIATSCHLASGHGGYGRVEYRIDAEPASSKGFEASTNNRALGLWSGRQSIPFIKQLLGHNDLLLRFTPFNSNPVTAKFDISGLDEAIAPLRESCGW